MYTNILRKIKSVKQQKEKKTLMISEYMKKKKIIAICLFEYFAKTKCIFVKDYVTGYN